MMTAKKIILALWLVVLAVANASALARVAPENRVLKNFGATFQTHQAQSPQTPETHQENGLAAYDLASGCCLAARGTTYTQMEFSFARGASVQTPGVTTAGETFVRVGAAPQNLKFGSTSLSGAQPGTYAFSQATFDAIGQNPAALKNFGDLPGSAPQYFRTLSPPPGTPIQRGIVPGGQYGGVGGVEEVIFPSGF